MSLEHAQFRPAGDELALTTKKEVALQANSRGHLLTAKGSPAISADDFTVHTDFGQNNTANLTGNPTIVTNLYFFNKNASLAFFQLFDEDTEPDGASVPVESWAVPGGQGLTLGPNELGENGIFFATGLGHAYSTAEGSVALGASADQSVRIRYKEDI